MFKIEELSQYASNNRKEFVIRSNGDLTIYKYSPRVHCRGLWNEFNMETRGFVIDSNNRIVSYPFSKFFNRFEDRADTFDNDEIVYANRKYNGFLAIVTVHDGRLLYHTAGSLSGEFVERIGRYVKDEWVNILDPNYTYMFECIATDDYHVTMEEEGLTLIGYRKKELGSEILFKERDLKPLAKRLGCHWAKGMTVRMSDLVSIVKTVDYEGFVVRSMDGKRCIKMKSPKFLRKRFFAYLTEQKADILDDLDFEEMDEEFCPLVHYVKDHKAEYLAMSKAERVTLIRSFFEKEVE